MTDTVNNSTSYLWYDYETFGTEARKDRPVQYGSFRTDTNFNIIGQSMVLYAQLADDYIPSPGSSLVTGITPMSLMDEENALAEADFAKVIRDEMGKPGTITIGYNNRNYDDEMTRFMFWRNLLPAYDTEYGEGRGRFDVFLLVIAVYAVAPQILNWPTKEDGTVCFKLDRLTPANNLPHCHAHDASSDAFATLQLAKLIASKNPRLWEYALSISKSDKIVELLNEKRPLLYVDRYSLHHRRGLRPVMPLFENPSVRNEWICWDLSADPNEMWAITEKDMKERSFVTREQKEQGIKPLPFVRIKTKKQPFLMKGMSVWITKNGQGLFELITQKTLRRFLLPQIAFPNFCRSLWRWQIERPKSTPKTFRKKHFTAGAFPVTRTLARWRPLGPCPMKRWQMLSIDLSLIEKT